VEQIVFCPVCGGEAPAGASRCPGCGAPFVDEPEVELEPSRDFTVPWLAILVALAVVALAVLLFVLLRA